MQRELQLLQSALETRVQSSFVHCSNGNAAAVSGRASNVLATGDFQCGDAHPVLLSIGRLQVLASTIVYTCQLLCCNLLQLSTGCHYQPSPCLADNHAWHE